ncbi:endonuclease/exonuclease/phosphatase family protein [Aeromicrobium chenweiae]|uniref:endonuclease/exonuclease/phosphatase family protein n=1 Tax=Aeromicrobium chenweiae TaxID=2079793 RepID=UPI00131F252E|nr:endonuclease/exonuclease/phosphatase family protein [Aeromicrobium chenweiae]
MRLPVVAGLVGLLVLAGLQPAAAASKPSKVGLVSFVGADYSRSHSTASLTLDWPNAPRAKKYQVFMSKSYSMKKAKTFSVKSSKIKISKLSAGRDYFFRVRGINGKKKGKKSNRVGHTTIVRPGPSKGLVPIRVMTYNLCSAVCDQKATTRYPWMKTATSGSAAPRQPAALERIAAANADVLATQEASALKTPPPGYAEAINASAKRLYFRESRLQLADKPAYTYEAGDKNGCRATTSPDAQAGHIFLGWHSKGCRYAVWAELVDKSTGRHFLAVNVHTVAGTSATAVANRRSEMDLLFAGVAQINRQKLAVVFAGDFNSHKNRTPDVVGAAMRSHKFRDAFDLARTLDRQHYNSYNNFKTAPVISYKWGDHVDHVFVDPSRSRVDAWRNIVLIGNDGRLVKPIPSDHSPLVVDVRLG